MGYLGVPRRAHISEVASQYQGAAPFMALNAISGVILFVAAGFFFYVIFATALQNRRLPEAQTPEIPFTEVVSGPEGNRIAQLTDRVGFWFAVAAILIVVAYGLPLIQMFTSLNPVPGMRLW